MINEGNQEELQDWQRQALLTEYEICEQDSSANSQSYWTLTGIFIGVSTAFLAGIIFGVLSNDSLFNALICQNKRSTTLIVGIIALVVGIAMIIILKMLKGWLRRIQLNIRINQRRMKEIQLKLGMNSWWRIPVADEWYEKYEKKSKNGAAFKCYEQKLDEFMDKGKFASGLTDVEKGQLKPDISALVQRLDFSGAHCLKKQQNQDKDIKYERPSSKKHHPLIFNFLILLWVLVVAAAVFLIIAAYSCWQWGLTAGVLIVIYIYYFIKEIWKLNKT